MSKETNLTELNAIFSSTSTPNSTKEIKEFVDETLYLPGDWTAQSIAERFCRTRDQEVSDVVDVIKRYLGS